MLRVIKTVWPMLKVEHQTVMRFHDEWKWHRSNPNGSHDGRSSHGRISGLADRFRGGQREGGTMLKLQAKP